MATIVITTFDLDDGVTVEAFVEADGRYQQEVAYQQPGLLRRTAARAVGSPGGWCVNEVWRDPANATPWHEGELGVLVTDVERVVYETLD